MYVYLLKNKTEYREGLPTKSLFVKGLISQMSIKVRLKIGQVIMVLHEVHPKSVNFDLAP